MEKKTKEDLEKAIIELEERKAIIKKKKEAFLFQFTSIEKELDKIFQLIKDKKLVFSFAGNRTVDNNKLKYTISFKLEKFDNITPREYTSSFVASCSIGNIVVSAYLIEEENFEANSFMLFYYNLSENILEERNSEKFIEVLEYFDIDIISLLISFLEEQK